MPAKTLARILTLLLGVTLPVAGPLSIGMAAPENSPTRLQPQPAYGGPSGPELPPTAEKVWVFFTDKGPKMSSSAIQSLASQTVSERSVTRRARTRRNLPLFDEIDLPVNPQYLATLKSALGGGARIIFVSKWLNAASVELDPVTLERLKLLPFIKRMQTVARQKAPLPKVEAAYLEKEPSLTVVPEALAYGPSRRQLQQIKVDSMHQAGYKGRGVRIGILDTGFFIDHHVFDSLRADNRLIATYDFINNDTDVQDNNFDGQRDHGTSTFSLIGSWMPDTLIGVAYGAEFCLAKTEIVATEYVISEEDRWVAGLEWMDSLGCDIVSSSLGYSTGDTGFSYTTAQMDGNTAITTTAADLAASRGILVVNSAGNEGAIAWRIIIAPADGDSVLAVGAVDSNGVRVSFSSMGPTADGRIKPDVMAQGRAVWLARVTGSYGRGSGTSFSCPLTSGVCALLLEANPNWGPFDLITRLHTTASRASNPDTLYGWGIVNAYQAADFCAVAGDVNRDDTLDLVDLIDVINNVFFGTPLLNWIAANANCDSAVDITDAVLLIQKVFFNDPIQCCL